MTAQLPPAMYGQSMYPQNAYSLPMYGQSMSTVPQQLGWQSNPMTPQYTTQAYSQVPTAMLPGTMMPGQNLAGDILGDHELAPTSSAAVPIVPNAFSGPIPVTPATWTNTGFQPTRRYHNSVR